MTLVRHVRVTYYSFGLLYCVRYIEVRYIEVLFHTVTLTGLKSIVSYTEDFVI